MSTYEIDLNDREYWMEKLQQIDQLKNEIRRVLQANANVASNPVLHRELNLVLELLEAIRIAWDMTEPQPGQVAAFTAEPVDDDERRDLRVRIMQSIQTAQESLLRAY